MSSSLNQDKNTEIKWMDYTDLAERPGFVKLNDGYVFSVVIPSGSEGSLLLYEGSGNAIPKKIPLCYRTLSGDLRAVFVILPEFKKYYYCYEKAGKAFADPYGTGFPCETPEGVPLCAVRERPKAVEMPPCIPMKDTVFYKLHVKGFTAHAGSGVKNKGTFRGLKGKLDYLLKLGITSLILMPCYEFLDVNAKEHVEGRRNYWGYDTGKYFAPKKAYCAGNDPEAEFVSLSDEIHKKGLELIPEFYFAPETPSGFVLDVLHHWRESYHVDGFHIVGSGDFVASVLRDPKLAGCKLLAGDLRDVRAEETGIRPCIAEYDSEYRRNLRCFLKGDYMDTAHIAWEFRRSADGFSYINYVTDQDGFTLNDLVSYGEKHNQENGEQNRDGNFTEYSWNCGAEGDTKSSDILYLRKKQMRNAFMMLLTSQGTPMLYAGDECLNSQQGNNNAWCQDNEIGWVSWSRKKAATEMRNFLQKVLKLRKDHPVLHTDQMVRMTDYKGYGCPDLSYHGETAWVSMRDPEERCLGVLYNEAYAPSTDVETKSGMIYVLYNMHWEPHLFALPDPPAGTEWYIKADTSMETGVFEDDSLKAAEMTAEKQIPIRPRSVMVLITR